MAWLWLVLGGLGEIGFTTCLRFVDGFRAPFWTMGFLVSVTISMALLEVASRSIPMGTAYAVWGGSARSAQCWSARSGSPNRWARRGWC